MAIVKLVPTSVPVEAPIQLLFYESFQKGISLINVDRERK